jgi:hypothetical protein
MRKCYEILMMILALARYLPLGRIVSTYIDQVDSAKEMLMRNYGKRCRKNIVVVIHTVHTY